MYSFEVTNIYDIKNIQNSIIITNKFMILYWSRWLVNNLIFKFMCFQGLSVYRTTY